MTKENITTGFDVTREQMIQLLNEDLAGEYQAIIAYTVYSQVLKGAAYTDIARQLEAVSYTHLDVYKRQLLAGVGLFIAALAGWISEIRHERAKS